MDAYTSFAQVYDMFMDNIPYDEWCKYLIELLKKHHIDSGIMLELGCGTGSVTRRMSEAGFSMIGIDNSEEMLSIAREKTEDSGILYLLQDMTEFELYGTVNAVVSICDSINYIIDEDDLLKVFKLVNNYLEKDGLFVFDMNTEYKYKHVLGDRVIAENREEGSFIWENTYYEDEKINEYDLTLYIREGAEDNYTVSDDNDYDIIDGTDYVEEENLDVNNGYSSEDDYMDDEEDAVYKRYNELHYQKAYSIDKIKELVERAGMEFVAVYDAFSYDEPKKDSERVYFVVKEGFQEGKSYEK